MGIRGFSSYIQQRSQKCLVDHKLHNCDIVIDGNNLLHFLYLSCPKQNASFGGDYNIFHDHVREVFLLFRQCKITATVVLDGGLDAGDRKQKTRLLRAKQKLVASIKVKPTNQHRMSVFPLMLKTVFLSALNELKVEVIQCEYEADADIAALARGKKCPVMSNDSDFYVMDVAVIPLNLMELHSTTKHNEGFAIQCKIFMMEAFLKVIGHEDPSIFPLLGTLLGNDYSDKRLFENIYSHIRVPKSKTMGDQHKRLEGLLDWLKGQSVEDAIDRILSFIKKIHHTEVEVAIRTSLEAYADENQGEVTLSTDLRQKIVNGLKERGLPEWFANLYVDSKIPPWVIEVITAHRMPYQSQVESVHRKNSFLCCLDILKAIAFISWDSQINNKLTTLWRKNSELVFHRLTPTHMDFSIPLPTLTAVSTMAKPERPQLLLNIILEQDCGRVMELPPKWQLMFAAIIHWIRHSQCRIFTYHVDALIACFIHLSKVEPRIGRISTLKRLETLAKSKAKDDPNMEYFEAAINTFKFQEMDPRTLSHDINYDRDTVHVLAEFQATYYFALTLHQILDTELQCPSPADFYWGTFINQAANLFKGYDRLALAAKLYREDSTLFKLFQFYADLVYEMSPPALKDWVPHGPNKPRKRKNKPKSKVEIVPSSSSDTAEADEDELDIALIGNRFRELSVA